MNSTGLVACFVLPPVMSLFLKAQPFLLRPISHWLSLPHIVLIRYYDREAL